MKQKTETMQTKEGLHTQGEWYADIDPNEPEYIMSKNGKVIACLRHENGEPFGNMTTNEAEANAELIVKAVNERQALLDSHRELKEAIEFYQKGVDHFFKCINWGKSFLDAEAIQFMNDHGIKFSKALNNAKNINP